MEFCPNGVFKEENGKPVVINPDDCVEFCRGCQKGACESDAITFFGDKKGKEIFVVQCSCGGAMK